MFAFYAAVELPMDVPQGTRAAFPIDELSDCCCIVTPECFDSPFGHLDMLHEMVHCHQSRTCENELKGTLKIYQRAIETGDYMWEINHPFPYNSSDFKSLVRNVSGWGYKRIAGTLSNLSGKLYVFDYEYWFGKSGKKALHDS